MSGVSAHPSVQLDQTGRHQVLDHHGQQPVCPVALGHPVAELAEYREVEARIIQFEPETILPVQAAADRLSGLPITHILRVLQHRHHGQPGRRQTPPPTGRKPVDKSSSVNNSSSRSRTHIAAVPRGLLALAIRTVSGGITRPESEPIAIAATPPTARSTPPQRAQHTTQINREPAARLHQDE